MLVTISLALCLVSRAFVPASATFVSDAEAVSGRTYDFIIVGV